MTPKARRATIGLALAGLLLVPVACGGDPEASYCSALSAKQSVFEVDGSNGGFLGKLPDLEALGKKAPSDLADEWQVFLDALETLNSAISAAGLKPSDVVDGKKPSQISDAQWEPIQQAANSLGTQDVADALDGIDQQAKDVCKIQLGL